MEYNRTAPSKHETNKYDFFKQIKSQIIYIYACVCVCVCVCLAWSQIDSMTNTIIDSLMPHETTLTGENQ